MWYRALLNQCSKSMQLIQISKYLIQSFWSILLKPDLFHCLFAYILIKFVRRQNNQMIITQFNYVIIKLKKSTTEYYKLNGYKLYQQKLNFQENQEMQDEILRIKQKDFTALDNKLFQNLQKADYLNSTLSNLQEFQKFLMNQINLYDNKVKNQISQKKGQNQSSNCYSQEKYTKDQKQIIIQNCQNLKKSILRVMPIEVQTETILSSQRQKEKQKQKQKQKQTLMNFSRTKNTKYSYSRILDNQLKAPIFQQTKAKINNLSQSRQYQRLIKQISQLRAQLESLTRLCKKNITQMQQENKNHIKKNVQSLLVQNNRLKTQNNILLRENQQKTFQLMRLQKKNTELERKNSLWEEAKNRMNSRCASIDKQLQSNIKSSYQHQFQLQSQQKSFQKSYKCFKQKLNFNFTNKLVQSQLHLQQNQENHSQTFRQSSSTLKSQTLINKNHFMSVQLKRQQNSYAENDNMDNHDLPRPLRRHSISNNLTKDAYSSKDLKNSEVLRQITKTSISMSQNVEKNLTDSNQQKLLNRKKSNHDITRKTKSNFFKTNSDTKNRQNLIQNLSEATQKAVRIKGLQQKRQRNPSKQKLKIFSFL